MSRFKRIYYYAILGAIGGLFSWQISNAIKLSIFDNIYQSELIIGGLIGLCFGLLIGLAEGIFRRSLSHGLRSAFISGLLGMIGGTIGLPIAEVIYQYLGGTPLIRSLGWGIFGMMVGGGLGFSIGSQAWKPAIGGFLGGGIGGALLEFSQSYYDDPQLGKVIGLMLLGLTMGTLIAFIVMILSKAWLEVATGKMKGAEFILDKFIKSDGPTAYIGSDALKADIVLPDPDIDPQHALLSGSDTFISIKDLSLSGTFVNNKKIEKTNLLNQHKIVIGNTELIFHEKRS